jgi:hypothetical protein
LGSFDPDTRSLARPKKWLCCTFKWGTSESGRRFVKRCVSLFPFRDPTRLRGRTSCSKWVFHTMRVTQKHVVQFGFVSLQHQRSVPSYLADQVLIKIVIGN